MSRYADKFLNALMYSHAINLSCELWYDNVLVAPLSVLGGSVTADRSGTARLTADVNIDPNHLANTTINARLNPYGSRIVLKRGVTYVDGSSEIVQIFSGRIDVVETSLQKVSLRCSDLNADIVDARFLTTMRPGLLTGAPTTIVGCIKGLIKDVFRTMTDANFDLTGISTAGLNQKVAVGTSWSQERADALDSLATQLMANPTIPGQSGSEWYVDQLGVGHIHPLPAIVSSGAQAVWVIDSGDEGVLIDRITTLDRAKVFNGCQVTGEPVNGTEPAVGSYTIKTGDMKWDGPFGKVVARYNGQQLDPNTSASAYALAETLTVNSISSATGVAVTCIPNPKLKLADIVRVYAPLAKIDANYYVQSYNMPLDPETAMTMVLYSSLTTTPAGDVVAAPPSIPRGATWEPRR